VATSHSFTSRSSLHVATRCASKLNIASLTQLLWPDSVHKNFLDGSVHNCGVSRLLQNCNLPSHTNYLSRLIIRTCQKCTTIIRKIHGPHSPCMTLQTHWLSFPKIKHWINTFVLYRSKIHYALGIQKRTVLSFEADANTSPSGENFTAVTTPYEKTTQI
jgi:hypothetical protein